MNSIGAAAETLLSAVYVSSAREPMTHEGLVELLDSSRENNKKAHITGLLLYRDDAFMQVIEGPPASIETLLAALARDTRHTGMVILKKALIPERQFGDWQMAFRNLNGADLRNREGYSPFMESSFKSQEFRDKPHLSYKLLLQFREQFW